MHWCLGVPMCFKVRRGSGFQVLRAGAGYQDSLSQAGVAITYSPRHIFVIHFHCTPVSKAYYTYYLEWQSWMPNSTIA